MPTETLQINGVGAVNNWLLGAGASKAVAVNQPDDADTTYIHDPLGGSLEQDLTFADTAIPASATINSVTFTGRVKVGLAGELPVSIQLQVGAQTLGEVNMNDTAAYADVTSPTYTLAPDGGAWTTAKINSMYVHLANNGAAANARCTTVYATITYTLWSSVNNLLLLGIG